MVLYDFEEEKEFDRLYWECKVFYARDKRHATRGKYSLRLEMYPSSYPGLKTGWIEKDWSYYRFFKVDIYNPTGRSLMFAYRIDDLPAGPPYEDRVNGSVVLSPGKNELCLDLRSLRTSGTARPLFLSHIFSTYLFLGYPNNPVTLFLDNIRLVR